MLVILFPLGSLFLIFFGYYRVARSHSRMEPHVRHSAYASLFFLACFSALAYAVAISGRASDTDYRIFGFFQSMQSSGMLEFMRSVSSFFDPVNFFVFALFLEAALFVRNHRGEMIFSSAVFVSAFVLDWSAKVLVASNRPFLPDMTALGWSFPSGHATLATAFFLTLYIFARPHIKDKEQRIGLLVFALLCALLVGVSRLYLGLHWFSDVVGGMLLGSFTVFFLRAQFLVPTEKRKR